MILLWKKNIFDRKAELTNFKKLGSLPKVFQIVLRGRGMGKLPGGFFYQVVGSDTEWFWRLEPFSKLKTAFCKYWTLIKMKISITCWHKEYEAGIYPSSFTNVRSWTNIEFLNVVKCMWESQSTVSSSTGSWGSLGGG